VLEKDIGDFPGLREEASKILRKAVSLEGGGKI
jgi:hypothetical protein